MQHVNTTKQHEAIKTSLTFLNFIEPELWLLKFMEETAIFEAS